jgi:phospholipid/cholesterol/gamma-HCH transport system substrate-binding protein
MLSKLAKGQVIAFVLVSLIAVSYASVSYLKLPQKLGFGRYTLSIELPNTAKLYEAAVVTLRGEEIGEVTKLGLTTTAVRATLSINDEARIPSDSVASVRSISALGEQYVDFEPTGAGGPALRDGDVVPASRVRLPVQETTLLDKVNALVASLPAKDLNTTIDELSTGFGGTGSDLQLLIDSTGPLLDAADANIEPTRRLITDLGPVLDTQRRLAPQIRSIFPDLATVTGQLRHSDSDLRGVLDKTPPFIDEVDDLVNQLRPTLPSLLHDLTNVGDVVRIYLPNVEHVVSVLPTPIHDLQSAIYGSPLQSAAKLSFKAVLNNPPACTVGFINRQRDINDLSPAQPQYDAFCKEPHDSAIGVRGGRNNECPNDPARRSNSAYGCGLRFQSNEDYLRSRDDATKTMLDRLAHLPTSVDPPDGAPPYNPVGLPPSASSARSPSAPPEAQGGATAFPTPTYDPGTGVFLAPGGQAYILGGRGANAAKPGTPEASDWRTLLLDPMGLPTR